MKGCRWISSQISVLTQISHTSFLYFPPSHLPLNSRTQDAPLIMSKELVLRTTLDDDFLRAMKSPGDIAVRNDRRALISWQRGLFYSVAAAAAVAVVCAALYFGAVAATATTVVNTGYYTATIVNGALKIVPHTITVKGGISAFITVASKFVTVGSILPLLGFKGVDEYIVTPSERCDKEEYCATKEGYSRCSTCKVSERS